MNNNSINRRRWHKENTSEHKPLKIIYNITDARVQVNEGVRLNVENFPHWVWVWGVEPYPGTDEYGQPLNRVFFIGDNIYNGLKADL